jgi:hypothetical protein
MRCEPHPVFFGSAASAGKENPREIELATYGNCVADLVNNIGRQTLAYEVRLFWWCEAQNAKTKMHPRTYGPLVSNVGLQIVFIGVILRYKDYGSNA